MSLNQSSTLVQRTIDLNYANKKRLGSFRWMFVNAVLLIIFTYDLSHKCPGYTSMLHYVELVFAAVLAANLVQHLLQLLPRRAPAVPLSRTQQRLLGLNDTDLDSSFIVSDDVPSPGSVSRSEVEESAWAVSDAELSLSPRSWRAPAPAPATPPSPPRPDRSSPRSPHSPAAPPSPRSPHSGSFTDGGQDCFIADRKSLTEYLKQFEAHRVAEAAPPEGAWGPPAPAPPPPYQLASVDTVSGAAAEEGSPPGSPQVWWQLDLDPQRLTQFNLNLRLWIHITILERLVREIERVDEALARAAAIAPGALRAGLVPLDRLRALARTAHPDAAALLPFLEPFPDQRYLVRRIRELASGECMSAYRWNGGGSEWDESKPTDAELVLHLVATYLDAQTSVGIGGMSGGRPFSSEYLSEGAVGRRGPGALGIHRVSVRPPHYALVVGEQRVELPRGRNNLLHTLLCLLAAAARRNPPTLARTHLGPAGLNMLWIIGR